VGQQISQADIRAAALRLLAHHRHITVRGLAAALRAHYGHSARTQRLARVVKELNSAPPQSVEEVLILREQLRAAVERAERAELRERAHQDHWAARYAEQVAALRRSSQTSVEGVSHQQYLAIHQRAAALRRRLARYEDPDMEDEEL
jgi:outer membrane murein-binding lipoprotein Lpp